MIHNQPCETGKLRVKKFVDDYEYVKRYSNDFDT